MRQELKERTFQYALMIAGLFDKLPTNNVNRAYFNQLIRCSSSVGANYRAARRAKSDNDFLNKLKIVEEEADESIYFLELLLEVNNSLSNVIAPIIAEGYEILKIIVASIRTTKFRMNNT